VTIGYFPRFVFLEIEIDADDPTPTDGHPLLDDLFVHPAFQKLGIGRRLIDTAEAWARACGSEQLVLGCLELDPAAQAFYLKTGWKADDGSWEAPDKHMYITFRRPIAIAEAAEVVNP
jgi:GNAT superfamily N-acetyltransferase